MSNNSLFYESWIKVLEEIETKLQLLSPPRGDSKISITERGDMLRKHYEATKKERLEIALELQKILENISQVYFVQNEEERSAIRKKFKSFERVSSMMEGLPKIISTRIKSNKDTELFRLGLLIASMQDQAIDSRDWFLSVGALIGTAKSIGIDPNPIIKEVAGISDSEKRKGTLWSTRDGLLQFIN